MERRRDAGGIAALLGLIREHRGALEYDWRTRFGEPLHNVGRSISWAEAARLVERLAVDPSSHFAASFAGWDYPLSREGILLIALRDATVSAHFRDPKPWPRPWGDPPDELTHRPDDALRQDRIDATLRVAAGRALPGDNELAYATADDDGG